MEANSWEVTVRLKDYRQARSLFALLLTLPNHSARFTALAEDGEPLWTEKDEARLLGYLKASETA